MQKIFLGIIVTLGLIVGIMQTAVYGNALNMSEVTSYQKANVDVNYNVTYTTEWEESAITKLVGDNTDVEFPAGWYIVEGEVTIEGKMSVLGELNLILADGCVLTVTDGINVPENSSLTIFGQSARDGQIIAISNDSDAAIGGPNGANSGAITIHGGNITGTSESGAGIGGDGTVTIYGGIVNGTSKSGAGIGGAGTVTIYGGIVNGTSESGAGIGGAATGNGNVIIYGGLGTGTSSSAEGIGSGMDGVSSNITIASNLYYATSDIKMPEDVEVVTPGKENIDYNFLKYVKFMNVIVENDAEEDDAVENEVASTTTNPWLPTTEEEIRAHELAGYSDVIVGNNFYEMMQSIGATMTKSIQGPKCIQVMDLFAPTGMEVVRTYNIFLADSSQETPLYTSDTMIYIILDIPESLQEEGAVFKMICVSENGIPYILEDLDLNPTTITFATNHFYAFGLYKTIMN